MILDEFVSYNKTQMSHAAEYACDMKDTRKLLAEATARLIGDGKKFRSARELAQRAHTMGYIENAASFSRQLTRVMKGDHDTQLSTVETIARTAGVPLSDFLAGEADAGSPVNPSIREPESALSIQSARDRRANLVSESLTQLSTEMREIVDLLVSIDRLGGDLRDITVETVRNMLRSLPSGSAGATNKEMKKRL